MSSNPTIHLINLGGPRNAEEIQGFLQDLFLDPYVFDIPLWEPFRKRLARFIAKKRAPKLAGIYASMEYGGGSPLYAETERQAKALTHLLEASTGETWKFQILMACGTPNLRDLDPRFFQPSENNVFLPLYPQFSRSTTLSTAMTLKSLTGKCMLGVRGCVDPFASDRRFQEVTASLIWDFFSGRLSQEDFPHLDCRGSVPDWEEIDIVFSAHGIPMRLVKKGDKYVDELENSIQGITQVLRKKGYKGRIHISYQSRVGPAKWTEPSTIQKLKELGQERKRVAVYPISFVGEHLETLVEIGKELKEVAIESGVAEYYRIPALGVYPGFIKFLRDLVLESRSKPLQKSECLCKKLGGEKKTCI